MAKKGIVAKVTPIEGGYTWEFSNGTKESVLMSEFNEEIVTHLALHGLKQKLSDPYAGAAGDPEKASGLFMKALDSLRAGEWAGKREGSTREEPIDLLIKAVVQVTSKAEDAVRKVVEAMDKATRRKLRSNPEVAKAIIDIKAATTKAPSLAELFG